MKLPKMFICTGISICLFFIACLPTTENKGNDVPESQTQIDNLVNTATIKHLKTTLNANFSLEADTIVYHALRNSNFSFFEGLIVADKQSSNNIKIQFYKFNSKQVCEKAHKRFLNGLSDLQNIQPGKKMRYIKSPPTFMIQNQQSLVLLKYNCANDIEPKKIKDLKTQLINIFSNAHSIIMDVECGGPVNWM